MVMRYSPEHKAETHARIVRKASVRLREKGAHGVGVADLMKEAGLTHGGFYAHFASREALVIEAFCDAMDRSTERWRKTLAETPADKRIAMIVDRYLTSQHRDDCGHGCAVPALGAEIARESAKTRKTFAAKLEQMVDLFADQIPDVPRRVARKRAAAMMATLMGTLVMSRIAGGSEFSDDILSAGREAALACAAGGRESGGGAVKSVAAKPAVRKAPARKAGAAPRR
jgi:TetR/AcrR family transcriptional repressor of nem operon